MFQDPKIAENTAGEIDICGVRYKILLMCRVNPKKIRQPKGFKDCWILNPLPSEIRPYRILIKRIFLSSMAGASQDEIITFPKPPQYYNDIMNQRDISFLSRNKNFFSDHEYVINLYTSNDYKYINNYLREGKITSGKYNEKEIKSWIYCLHTALTKNDSDVSNNSIYYRGICKKFPKNLGIGAKFNFGEFISVSEDKNIALSFAGDGTLLIIRIENNNKPNFYCKKISNLSQFPEEKEILITSHCTFQVTNKIYKNDKHKDDTDNKYDYDTIVDEIYLTCEGYRVNEN